MIFHHIKKLEKICRLFPQKDSRFTSAVILAAGKSERMNCAGISKQLIELEGIPVVVHALLAFEKSEKINEIIVVGAKDELALYKDFKKKFSISKLKTAVEGGASRAESAAHGFRMISKNSRFVAIHDAARCLITTKDIDRVLLEAYRTGAAIAAKKATDTIKKADENGFVSETIDRTSLWLAQTPQIFKKSVYEVALAKNGHVDSGITDDAMLVELAGFRVKLVACENNNLKITTGQDLNLARELIQKRKGGGIE